MKINKNILSKKKKFIQMTKKRKKKNLNRDRENSCGANASIGTYETFP